MSATGSARSEHAVEDHFAKSAPVVRATYDAILKAARKLGPFREDPKKTSIHLVKDIAFAGVATRKEALVLTLKSERDVKHPRIHRAERASANRWHLEVRLAKPAEVDAELRNWLERAYKLG